MSKTAREVLAEALDGPGWDERTPDQFIAALDTAGFVIVPKEPTHEMMEAAGKALYERRQLIGGLYPRPSWPSWDNAGLLKPELRAAATHAYRAATYAAGLASQESTPRP